MNGKKLLASLLAATMVFSLSALPTKAQWTDVGSNKRWLANGSYATGWEFINEKYYFFDKSGNLAKGWFIDDSNSWYFSDYETGIMQTGWVAANSTDWYYLNPANGIMQADKEFAVGNDSFLFNQSGMMLRGDQTFKGRKYVLKASGEVISRGEQGLEEETGAWQEEGGQYYYVKNGQKQKGWLTLDSKKYYLDNTGKMLIGTQTIDGKTYEFARNGVLLKEIEGNTDYADTYESSINRVAKKELIDMINIERIFEKVDPLLWIRTDDLDKAAYIRANELTEKYSDTRPNGKDWDTVLTDLKLKNDNVEEYYVKADTAEEALEEFIDEKYAYRAMLDEDYTSIAVGVAKSGSTFVWVFWLTDSESSEANEKFDASANKREKRYIAELLNEERDSDLTLAYNNGLDKAAYKRAVEIAEKASSKRPNGKSYETVLDEFDVEYSDSYECYVIDEDDEETIVEELLSTKSDRRAIEDSAYGEIGIGMYTVGKKTYTVILLVDSFQSKASELFDLINDERTKSLKQMDDLDDAVQVRAQDFADGYSISEPRLTVFLDDEMGVSYTSSTAKEIRIEDEDDIDEILDILLDKHESVILGTTYKYMAIGVVNDRGTLYWDIILTTK